jgi:hypothetical protein
VTDAHAENSALGYSGTNSGGHLIIEDSEWNDNKTGISTNSQNNDDAPSPQDGACPGDGVGPTGSHSCTLFRGNFIHDNNNPNVPNAGSAAFGPVGTGMVLAGGRNDTVIDNRVQNQGSWGILVVPYPDAGPPPPVAHCEGGDMTVLPGFCTTTRGGTRSPATSSRTSASSGTRRTATSPRSAPSTTREAAGTTTGRRRTR